MSDLRKAAQQALEFLEAGNFVYPTQLAAALRAALAQQPEPVQEPVAYIHRQGKYWEVSERFLTDDEKARGWTEEPLYTNPPQRPPLTDEEIAEATAGVLGLPHEIKVELARAVERKVRGE